MCDSVVVSGERESGIITVEEPDGSHVLSFKSPANRILYLDIAGLLQ